MNFAKSELLPPPKLLVVADGPCPDRPGEAKKCDATRAIIEQVDWPCELLKNHSDHNLGCKIRVFQWDWLGISSGRRSYSYSLKDDCLPDPSFFRFCEELLYRYRDDDRIGQIERVNFQLEARKA